jgi:hypothetical protein
MLQFVNSERTVLVTVWPHQKQCEVATRPTSSHIWGPPVTCNTDGDIHTEIGLALLAATTPKGR